MTNVLAYEYTYMSRGYGEKTNLRLAENVTRPQGERIIEVNDLVEASDQDDTIAWAFVLEYVYKNGYTARSQRIQYDEPDRVEWATDRYAEFKITNKTPLGYK